MILVDIVAVAVASIALSYSIINDVFRLIYLFLLFRSRPKIMQLTTICFVLPPCTATIAWWWWTRNEGFSILFLTSKLLYIRHLYGCASTNANDSPERKKSGLLLESSSAGGCRARACRMDWADPVCSSSQGINPLLVPRKECSRNYCTCTCTR